MSLATARRVGELQVVARDVSFSGSDAFLSYLPEFRAKTESAVNPLPRSFCVRSLNSFVGNLPDELLLCPVRALRAYLSRTSSVMPRPRTLFVSPRSTSRSLSKNALSFFLRDVISRAYSSSSSSSAVSAPSSALAHSVRGVATSWAFARNASLSSVLAAASWSSSTVFTSSIFLTSSFLHLKVLVWDLLWLQVPWCKFLLVCFSPFLFILYSWE